MSRVIDAHRQFLADGVRISLYQRALQEMVRPGAVVLDLGSGTGILGLLACRAGAGRVYSIEQGGMIEVARAVCRANGFQDRVTFLKGHSLRLDLPERVDLIVCDQIGRFGFENNLLQLFDDAQKRFLKPGGVLVPSRLDFIVALADSADIRSRIEFWDQRLAGFDFCPVRSWAANTGYPLHLTPEELLSEPAVLKSVDFSCPDPFTAEVELRASRPGSLQGIGGWFSAQLSPHVTLTNSPLAKERIDRRNVFLPLDKLVALAEGDLVRVRIHAIPSETIVTWKVEVREKGHERNGTPPKARFTHSTLQGMLMNREDLRRTQPDHVPKLNRWAQARRSVLELCDGQRALKEIELEVQRRHADLFHTLPEAAMFVAEVVTRYSE